MVVPQPHMSKNCCGNLAYTRKRPIRAISLLMDTTATPNTYQQFFRVLRHEPPWFIFILLNNTITWFFHKYLLRQPYLQKNIHDYRMCFDLSDPGISRSLLLVGDREREHRFILKKAVQSGNTILDLGANIGYYVLMEQKIIGPSGHVIAIEPEPKNFALLQRNIDLNFFTSRTTAINAAVSDHDGSAPLFLSKLGNVHSLKEKQTNQYTGQSISVQTISLSTIADRYPNIHLIRMDIEGYEQEILRSLIQINTSKPWLPKILFELHPPKYTDDFPKLLSDLYTLGYRASYLATSSPSLLAQEGLTYIAKLPTDGTVRYIATQVPLSSLLKLYPRTRAVLLEHA
ncbi:MAG TPA: hypothetical protein DDW41_01515 [Candidatus Andersenbacteria bacterium]|nr:hypothetical protein [Candidatus Andersenbacteria bacterium]